MNTIDCYLYITSYLFSDDLSYNKSATQSHTFKGTIYEAGRAVDRNTTTCMRTLEIGTTSYYKTVWWKVDLGGVYSIYSINILFRNYDGNNSLHGWCILFLILSVVRSILALQKCYMNMKSCCYVLGSILNIVNKVVHKQVERRIMDFYPLNSRH